MPAIFLTTIDGHQSSDLNEAVVVDPKNGNILVFRATAEGYVRFDDWSSVDTDSMIADIREGTASHNQERINKGLQPIDNIEWRDKPALDQQAQIVHWALEAQSGGHELVNATVIIVWPERLRIHYLGGQFGRQ